MTRRTGRLARLLLALLAARVPGQEPRRETVEVSESAALTLRVGKTGRGVQLAGKVRFVLDGDAVGVFLQTQADATMRTQPSGLTLCETSQAVTAGRRVHEWQPWCHLLYLGVASVAGPELPVPTYLRTLRE